MRSGHSQNRCHYRAVKNGKSCAPPFNSPHLCVNQRATISNSIRHSDQQIVLSLQWNWKTFPQHADESCPKRWELHLLCYRNISCIRRFNRSHIRCCVASIIEPLCGLQTWKAEDVWIIYISCHRLLWCQRTCSPGPIILLLFAGGRWDIFSVMGCFSDSCRGKNTMLI